MCFVKVEEPLESVINLTALAERSREVEGSA